MSRAGPATAVHSAWGGTGAFRGHVLARGDPSSLPGLLQGSQSRARPPKICLARGGEHTEPGRRCCHLRPGALGWHPAPRGVPYLEHLLLGGVVGVGQAVPSLSVLAGDEVPSLLGAAVRGDGLGGGEPSGPEPVGSVISQHDEELWESPMVMASPRASRRVPRSWRAPEPAGGAGFPVFLHPEGGCGAAALTEEQPGPRAHHGLP